MAQEEKGQAAVDYTNTDKTSDIEIHDDEAANVISTYAGPTSWTKEEERNLLRKIDWRLMPILCITYGLQYYDKSMLSQAALFGLRTDLSLTTGDRYSMSASIFYLGFIAGAYPAVVLAQRYSIERVASAIVTLWGVCLILTTACTTYRGIYAQRFFLGFLEAGVSPMFMLVVGMWYTKSEQAFRMGIFYSCTGFVAIVSPLINYGWGHITGQLSQWMYMYFFAGAITIIWGILLLFILAPDPVRAKRFDERERYILVARLKANNSGVMNKTFKASHLVELLTDLKFWLVFWIATLCMISNGAISTFLPLVIKGFGFSTFRTLLLYMPVGAYAGGMMLILTFCAMRFASSNIRTHLIFFAQTMTTLAAALLYGLPSNALGGLLFAAYILPTVGAGYTVLMGLQIANTAGYTKRSLASSGLFVGYCLGNFIGPLVFLESEAPTYATGFAVTIATSAAAGILALVYRLVCIRDNCRRDATGSTEGFEYAYDDPTDLKNAQFRYIL